MKNIEKFAEQIIDIALKRDRITVNLESGELGICGKTKCSECLFSESNKDCEVLLKEWAEKEYEEQSVDWSKVAVDTPILVRDYEEDVWGKRHFAKYENGMVYAWDEGTTSWSACESNDITSWKMAKLAEEVES